MRPRPSHRPRPALALAALLGLALAGAHAASAQVSAPPSAAAVVARDPADAAGGLDLTRVQLGRAADGRLRAALTLAAPWRMRDLPAGDGPPGSLCVRMWTQTGPVDRFPDHLLCVTADAGGRHLTGSIMTETAGRLRRTATARLARSSPRTVVARFAQSAIGRPDRVRFAGEATTPGCSQPACVDVAPNAPATATLTLRAR